jgi:putative ATPase
MEKPLAVKMRPSLLKEFVGQNKIISKNMPLYNLINNAKTSTASSIILYGPPGTGKTTLAYLIANDKSRYFKELSATSATVKEIRAIIEEANYKSITTNKETVLFIDEVHRFSKAQQDVLLPSVENKQIILIAATTQNPSFSIISPLLSRSILFKLEKLTNLDIKKIVKKALLSESGFKGNISLKKDALNLLADLANGDARKALTILETTITNAKKSKIISAEDISKVINIASLKYDKNGDEHYDVISAFIKSVRGSDANAALHYLARMIIAGEDPRFIARRLIILSSEDIGLADSNALTVANNAMLAVEKIGMPEAELTLAHATLYLSLAPKSNSAYISLSKAKADIINGKFSEVPKHLRDSHYSGAKKLGHGLDYIYAHNEPFSIAKQQYLPDKIKNANYYNPVLNGFEKTLSTRWNSIKKILK